MVVIKKCIKHARGSTDILKISYYANKFGSLVDWVPRIQTPQENMNTSIPLKLICCLILLSENVLHLTRRSHFLLHR